LRSFHYRNQGNVGTQAVPVAMEDMLAAAVVHIAPAVVLHIVAVVLTVEGLVHLICLPTSYYS
jgi:hypothetical protein